MTTRHVVGTVEDANGVRAQVVRHVSTKEGEALALVLDGGPDGFLVFELTDHTRSQLMRMLAGEKPSPVRLVK